MRVFNKQYCRWPRRFFFWIPKHTACSWICIFMNATGNYPTCCRYYGRKNSLFQLKNITSNSISKNSQSFFACSMVNCDGSFSNLRNVETWTCNASAHSFCVFFRMSRVAFGVRCFIQKTSCYIITHFNYMGYKNYSQPQLVELFSLRWFPVEILTFLL